MQLISYCKSPLLRSIASKIECFVVEVQDRAAKLIPESLPEYSSTMINKFFPKASVRSLRLDDIVTVVKNLTLSSRASEKLLALKKVRFFNYSKKYETLLAFIAKSMISR